MGSAPARVGHYPMSGATGTVCALNVKRMRFTHARVKRASVSMRHIALEVTRRPP